MNRLIKTILIISIFLPFASARAQVDNLVVEFQQTPLFNEANFLPGEGVSRRVKVTNNSGQIQRIATEAINKNDPDNFASQLDLIIKEGPTVIFNSTLAQFFDQGETYLSDLASGAQTQYDFTIIFHSGSGNEYQEKSLGFDILVGFEGTEGGLPLPSPGNGTSGGGGGGSNGPPDWLPPGLVILNETAVDAGDVSATITWQTSYPATSQVIYALENESHILDLTDTDGTPPKYGYARTTSEYDVPANINGNIFHSITISGLTPGETYYYRAVSHGSLAISTEHSFTTLTPEEMAAAIAIAETSGVTAPTEKKSVGEEETFSEEIQIQEQEKEQQEAVSLEGSEENNEGKNLAAAFLGFLNSDPLYWLIILVVLLVAIYLLWRRTKDKKTY